MSGKIAGRVWDLDLPHGEKYVLLAMADHADHQGCNIHPSIGLIAWKTDYSARQVVRLIQALRTRGVLVLEEDNSESGMRSNLYRIDFTNAPFKPDFRGRDDDKKRPKPRHTTDTMSPPRAKQGVTKSPKTTDTMSQRGDLIESQRGDLIESHDPSLTVINPPNQEPLRFEEAGGEQVSSDRERTAFFDAENIQHARTKLAQVPLAILRAAAADCDLPHGHKYRPGRIVKRGLEWTQGQWQPAQPAVPPVQPTQPTPPTVLPANADGVPYLERWTGARAVLATTLPAQDFVTWIEPTALLELTDTAAIIGTPNCFVRDTVQVQYAGVLADALGVDTVEVVISQEVRP